MPNPLALDIGGANIKVADGLGYARSWPFALWKSPEQLAGKLEECLFKSPPHERIVATMTGELCDCFETKRDGVRAIVEATLEAARHTPALFYQSTGQFVAANVAMENHLLTAASNWHAVASFAARYCHGLPGMLIDIGSTTTDIIPVINGKEAARGRTDPERLGNGELAYMGVERTPVCSLVTHFLWREGKCLAANEFFATTGDVYLLLGELPEDPSNTNTADGKPFTCDAAHNRMARMICSDRELVSVEDARGFASHICEAQLEALGSAFRQVIERMPATSQTMILSGQGEFLARRLLNRLRFRGNIVSLNETLGPEISRCAPAHALAVLARETQ